MFIFFGTIYIAFLLQAHTIVYLGWILYLRNVWISAIRLLSHPGTGGDFMFLYRFVRHRRRPHILVHAITFEQLFGFLSFLARLLALTYRLTD